MSGWPSVAVAGGSLGGLTAALVLRDLGCDIHVYERATSELESRGAGIVVLDETSRYLRERTDVDLGRVTVSTTWLRYLDRDGATVHREHRPYRYSGWHTLYRTLLGRFDAERYHLGREMVDFVQDDRSVQVRFADGDTIGCDLLVCADGIGSSARARLLAAARARYAGYVAWRGIVPEERVDPEARAAFADTLVYQVMPHSHILVYPIPSLEGETQPGRRLLNFVWYRNVAEGAELEDLMTDRAGVVHETTLPPGAAREEHERAMRRLAERSLAPPLAAVVEATTQPFVQVIFDIEVDRMAFGRICLIGDAAFALRPHIAAGTAKAAADAWALGDALAGAGGDVPEALEAWEAGQLELGRTALQRARRNGDRSQFECTWRPEDPELAYGLWGPGR
ncbi:MAG TPA: FAD-dependent monooxygenase [Actinomycetota bacterium]|nr:FAD-dependent monooxygenase [Actinomycetota bacterium]